MTALPWLLIWVAQASPAGGDVAAWCERLGPIAPGEEVAAPETWEEYESLLATLPPEFSVVATRSRAQLGADADEEVGKFDGALAVLKTARAAACRPTVYSVAAAQASAEAILKDPAFRGERESQDIIDRLIERLQAWFLEILESDAMQQYAEGSRFAYLIALVLLALIISWRLFLARRRRVLPASEVAASDLQRLRLRDARTLLKDARQALTEGAERRAIHLAFLGLLVWLGEHEEGAVEPALTSREILARLDPTPASAMRPLFSDYERNIYQDAIEEGAARAFVSAVQRSIEVAA